MGRQPGSRGGRKESGRGGGRKGPRLPSSLLRNTYLRSEKKRDSGDGVLTGDVYEYEERVAEEESGKNRRYDAAENVDYELPSDFEDEEIDEDTAFGADSDKLDDRVSKKKRRSHLSSYDEVDLNSDEDDEKEKEEDEEELFLAQFDEEPGVPMSGKTAFANSHKEGDDDDDDDDDASDGEEEEEEEEEEEKEEEKRHQQMLEAVTGTLLHSQTERAAKQKKIVMSEALPESEYNLNPGGNFSTTTGVSVEELMGSLHSTAGFGALRKRMQQLQKKQQPVTAPLPKIIQERVERKVGYEKTKDEVTKWQALVKKNREAPSLVFNEVEKRVTSTIGALADKFKPATNMEKEIALLLEESQLDNEKAIEAAEALELNKLTVEEVRERQERLAKMRSLLFQHEAKAKRIRKIKSKTFHRLDKSRKVSKDIPETDAEALKEASLKQEMKRTQERMTLKHKNTSRWAKRILKRGMKAHEDGSRDAIVEQLRTHSMLTRKIQSAGGSSSEESSSEEEEEDSAEAGPAVGRKSDILAKAKVQTLQALQGDGDAEVPTTGLFALPFMVRGIEKRKMEAREEARAVLEQLEEAEVEHEIAEDDTVAYEARDTEAEGAAHSGRLAFGDMVAAVPRGNTRKKFKHSNNVMDVDDFDSEVSADEDDEDLHRNGQESNAMEEAKGKLLSNKRTEEILLSEDYQQMKKGHKSDMAGFVLPDKKLSRLEFDHSAELVREPSKSGRNLVVSNQRPVREAPQYLDINEPGPSGREKHQSKKSRLDTIGDSIKEQAGPASSKVTVTMAGVPTKVDKKKSLDIAPRANVASVLPALDDGQAERFLVVEEEEEDGAVKDDGLELLGRDTSQQELIRQAFAGDSVEAEFQEIKARVVDEEVPRTAGPVSLPGWGQWTNVQQKKGQPGWILKEQENLRKSREAALKKRTDAKLQFVIVSEKVDKKGTRFVASKVPFPYKSREVFEKTMRMPIGREYNTDQVFRDMIRPAEIRSAGTIIDPPKFDKSVGERESMDVRSYVVKRKRERIRQGSNKRP